MNYRIIVCALLLITSGTSVVAQEDARRGLAEELLTMMDVQKNMEQVFDAVRGRHKMQLEKMGVSGEDAAKAEATQSRVMDLMVQELSWDKLKDDYISVYAETFTEEELKGIIAFYQSPVGVKFREKMPELMQRSMAISQRQMMEIMPKIQAITSEAAKPVERPALPLLQEGAKPPAGAP